MPLVDRPWARMPRSLIAAALVFAVAGCGPLIELPGGGGGDARIYKPSPIGDPAITKNDQVILFVEQPSVPGELRSNRLVVIDDNQQVSYLTDVRWVDRTPRLLQRYLATSLDGLVGETVLGSANAVDLPADFRLKVDVREFYLTPGSAPSARLVALARVVRNGPAELINSKVFQVTAGASGDDARQLVTAANDAMEKLARDLADWLEEIDLAERTAKAASR